MDGPGHYKHVQYNENKMKKSKPYCKCHATLFIILKGRLWNERTKDAATHVL